MKIVHIEDFFHPDAGYQVNILSKYQVKQGYDVTVITSNMKKIPEGLKSFFGSLDIENHDKDFTERTGVKVIRVPIYKYYSGRSLYTLKLFRTVRDLGPEILFVHGNSSFAGIIYTLFYKRLGYPMIMDNHMLEMATTNRFYKLHRWFYRNFIGKIIVRNGIKIIRMVNDDYSIKNLGIPEQLSPIISFGTDTMQFKPDDMRQAELRIHYNISDAAFVVLYMGKLTQDKGAMLLAKAFKDKFNVLGRLVVLVLVGNVSSDYGKEVEKELNSCENLIMRFPTQKYSDLPDFYHLSDIAVFPRQCSLSFYDAQACGKPVIIEDNSVNIERVSMNNGLLFKSGDYKDLRAKIKSMAELSDNEFRKMKEASVNYINVNNLDYEVIAEQYDSVIENCVVEFRTDTEKN